jgi:uncharacterized protein involved in exopolysaccharide biosynthesis/Mrp family chromosome partitioning ATPase
MRRDMSFAAMPAEAPDGQIDLAGLARALWRRKVAIVLPTIVAGLAAAIYVTMATPLYRSQSLVLIENRDTAYYRPGGIAGSSDELRPPDPEAVQSEVQLALSRDLARAVVRELKLAERPEFNPDAGVSLVGGVLRLIGLVRDPSRLSQEERVLERYYEHLSVYAVEKSRVITIEFSSESAILAAEAANAVAKHLLVFQREAKQETMRQASEWLAHEIEELRKRVSDAEARAEAFRGKSNLYIGSNNNTLSAQQLGELNSQVVAARAQRADAESKARLIREMLRSRRPIEASDIVNSELIRRLNEQRITLQAQLAEQSSTLLDKHPRIKELKAQIADLEAQTRAEAMKLVRSLENDVRIAGARIEALAASLDQSKKQASALGAEDVQLRSLEREAKSQRDLLETYLARYRDLTSREGPNAVQPDARVVSQAVPAPSPYFPKKLPIVLIVMLATAMVAVTLITLAELLNSDPYVRAVKPSGEVPRALSGVSPSSWIEAPSELAAGRHEPAAAVSARQFASLAKHVCTLGQGVVIVAPALGEESAGDVAVELARELARDGARVALLDCDVAKKCVSAYVGDKQALGLADLLFGVAHFSEVIQRDRASRVHIIPVGRGIRDMAAMMAGERLSIVLGALSQTYDHVLLATPALSPVPGASRLARFTAGVLLVTSDREESSAASASDALSAQGFRHVAVVSVGAALGSSDKAAGQAAA